MVHAGSDRVTTGVCSVTFRSLGPAAIIHLAAGAGLGGIEWGGDVHVPSGDTARAAAVARETADAGLRVLSYGSYWRAEDDEFSAVLATAVALGAPRIRVWAGRTGSAEASDRERDAVVARLRAAAELAASDGVELGLEFHGGSLTDTVGSTARLVDEVGHPTLRSYWQPPLSVPDADALAGLDELASIVSTVHVFSWWPGTERRPLSERAGLWTAVVRRLIATGTSHDLLLEFVPDDNPKLLAGEAQTLRKLISTAREDIT